jgi:iron-sulfur cluster repair protein YtfE (RIC family)
MLMDLFSNEHNFDLDKSRQKIDHGLKEHLFSESGINFPYVIQND